MPMIKVHASKEIPDSVLLELSAAVAEGTGKPEQYVMAVAEKASTSLGGTCCDAAYVEVKGIGGLDGAMNRDLSARICSVLENGVNIPPAAVYIVFQSIAADHWGWNNSTFG